VVVPVVPTAKPGKPEPHQASQVAEQDANAVASIFEKEVAVGHSKAMSSAALAVARCAENQSFGA
jgi:hypothetical protein